MGRTLGADSKIYRIKQRNDPIRNVKRKANYRAWTKLKRRTDVYWRMKSTFRGRLIQFLKRKGAKKKYPILKLVGCSKAELKQHLEKQFYPRKKTGELMTWKNHSYHGWHVDHIKPMNAFKNEDVNDVEVQKKIMNYKNLQPLWAEDNYDKRDKWEEN